MKIPSELKPAAWGAVGGAVVLAIIGFTWGGWVTGATAESTANDRAEEAVVAALAPICAAQFREATNAAVNLATLKETKSYEQRKFVEEGGWATMPGQDDPESGVAAACAKILGEQT
jgi:hypothetical protein